MLQLLDVYLRFEQAATHDKHDARKLKALARHVRNYVTDVVECVHTFVCSCLCACMYNVCECLHTCLCGWVCDVRV